jgi:hypothetical protein
LKLTAQKRANSASSRLRRRHRWMRHGGLGES